MAGAGLFFVSRKRRITGRIVGADAALGHRIRDDGFPAPDRQERVPVVIVGGGIAGLAAAHALRSRGVEGFVVLEMGAQPGGNSISGANAVSAFPWGAHYLPLPGPEAEDVLRLLRELGVILGEDPQGLPVYREDFLVQDPVERLFVHGRWQEGLVPNLGLGPEERASLDAFFHRMAGFKERRGSDGRPAFAIPLDASSTDPGLRALDGLPFADWLRQEGFTGESLRWYVDYCCRDDYGMASDRVSAWAGLHYFAARRGEAANAPSHAVLTWPEGNGWLVQRVRKPLGDRVRGGMGVFRVQEQGGATVVEAYDAQARRSVAFLAERVVMATPRFITHRLLEREGPPSRGAVYAPWLVANLTLESLPEGRGAPVSWDNVWQGSRSLGYIVANHQSLHPVPRATVLTYYLPLDATEPGTARRVALERSWDSWRDQILEDFCIPHPGLSDRVLSLDLMVWGHGMVSPTPGSLWNPQRRESAQPQGRVHFAHSDLSGISIFEEAWTHGVRAGREVADLLKPG